MEILWITKATMIEIPVIEVELDDEEMETCCYYARPENGGIGGGRSHVRLDRRERVTNIREDQMTGMVTVAAFHLVRYGHLGYFIEMREEFRDDPYRSDGGHDVPEWDINLDVKGRQHRNKRYTLDDYGPLVRPEEYNKDWWYVAGVYFPPSKVTLIGWTMGFSLRCGSVFNYRNNREERVYYAMADELLDLDELPPVLEKNDIRPSVRNR